MSHHFHSDSCYAPGPGDTEVLVCGLDAPVITAHELASSDAVLLIELIRVTNAELRDRCHNLEELSVSLCEEWREV